MLENPIMFSFLATEKELDHKVLGFINPNAETVVSVVTKGIETKKGYKIIGGIFVSTLEFSKYCIAEGLDDNSYPYVCIGRVFDDTDLTAKINKGKQKWALFSTRGE